MKSFIRLLLLLFIVISLVTSCKKPVPSQTRHIPKEATFVAAINTKSLQAKLAKNQATLENILRSVTGSDTTVDKGKQEWEDLKQSGIDLDENFYLSIMQKGGGMTSGDGTMIFAGLATLKDESKLIAYLKKKQPTSEVKKEKDFSYANTSNGSMVAWGNDLVVMMTYQKSYQNNMQFDSATGSYNFKNPVNPEAGMKLEMESYFNLKEDESVASIPEFRDLMQDKGDASMWISSSSSMDNLPMTLPKLKELFGNIFTAATLSFEDGKIAVATKSYYSTELRDLINKYPASNADLGLVENYPSDNINAFAVFSFNPQLINGIVKYLEVGGVVDGYLTRAMGSNYTLEDALKVIKGDFAVVASDFAMPSIDTTAGVMNSYMPKVQVVINVPVGDKAQMNKVMDKLVEMNMLVKTSAEYKLAPSLERIGWQVSVDDKNLLIASSESLLAQYKSKSKKAALPKGVMDDFKDRPGVFYVNIESVLNGIPAQQNKEVNNILPKARETFKDMKGYSENFNGKYAEGHFELNFKNEKENSLTSLLGFIETVSKNIPKTPAVNVDDMMMDSTTTNQLMQQK